MRVAVDDAQRENFSIRPLENGIDGAGSEDAGEQSANGSAGAVHAEKLIILSNVPGLLRQFPDESTLIPRIAKDKLEPALEFAEGRMKKKVLAVAASRNRPSE